MARDLRPVFLERKNYRRRRMMDALRLVAVLGLILWLMPIIWPNGRTVDADPMPMSSALFYVFGVWLFLIALAALLAVFLRDVRKPESETENHEGQDI